MPIGISRHLCGPVVMQRLHARSSRRHLAVKAEAFVDGVCREGGRSQHTGDLPCRRQSLSDSMPHVRHVL